MSAQTTPIEPTTPLANEGCLSRLVGVCNSPFHPEWRGKECQCVTCQPVGYCVEDPCKDCCDGPVDGCQPPDDDDNPKLTLDAPSASVRIEEAP